MSADGELDRELDARAVAEAEADQLLPVRSLADGEGQDVPQRELEAPLIIKETRASLEEKRAPLLVLAALGRPDAEEPERSPRGSPTRRCVTRDLVNDEALGRALGQQDVRAHGDDAVSNGRARDEPLAHFHTEREALALKALTQE